MPSLRSIATAAASAAAVLATSAGPALAAFQSTELDPTAGPVGTPVTVRIEMSGRIPGTAASPLLLIDKEAFDDAPSASHCEEIPGARVVGQTTWQAATVEYAGQAYSGVAGSAAFTVPEVPVGLYHLAETIDARGTGCFVFASFTVTGGTLPDTAMSQSTVLRVAVAVLLALVLVAAGWRARHGGSGSPR